jgi:hypothetical protein
MNTPKTGHHICAVCGWRHLQQSQRAPSGGASYEICPACGFEPGFTDDDQGHTLESWREVWVKGGLAWFSKGKEKPADWNPISELHALLKRKRPVIPAIRMRKAQALREGVEPKKKAPAKKATAPKTKAAKKAAQA